MVEANLGLAYHGPNPRRPVTACGEDELGCASLVTITWGNFFYRERFVILDFEGEPARPLGERRRKRRLGSAQLNAGAVRKGPNTPVLWLN
jgi:hypothetical protein